MICFVFPEEWMNLRTQPARQPARHDVLSRFLDGKCACDQTFFDAHAEQPTRCQAFPIPPLLLGTPEDWGLPDWDGHCETVLPGIPAGAKSGSCSKPSFGMRN